MPEFILNTAPALSHERAAAIAASWGSYQRDGDAGAVFYAFTGTGPLPDDLRAAALAYCDRCISIARDRAEETGAAHDAAKVRDDADLRDLEALRRYIAGAGKTAFDDLDEFAQGFIEAAFFCSTSPAYDRDEWDSEDCQREGEAGTRDGDIPGDASTADIDPASLEAVKALCDEFQREAAPLLAAAYEIEGYGPTEAGRDFYYTRAGHGVGYWSRAELGEPLGTALSEAAGRGEISLAFDAASGVTFDL